MPENYPGKGDGEWPSPAELEGHRKVVGTSTKPRKAKECLDD